MALPGKSGEILQVAEDTDVGAETTRSPSNAQEPSAEDSGAVDSSTLARIPSGPWRNAVVGLRGDPWLEPFVQMIRSRCEKTAKKRGEIEAAESSLHDFALGYKKFGFNRDDKRRGWVYREWAPGARELSLFGDFNGWNRHEWAGERNEFGVWTVFVPDKEDGTSRIPHRSRIKAALTLSDGSHVDRIPAWISRVEQTPREPAYHGVFWDPPEKYVFKHPRPPVPKGLRIYEAHVGIGTADPRIGTYNEFRENVLPRIKGTGYNAVQLMAIMEHPYYASFGYQITSFFAASSRYGTPEELMALVDEAHRLGLLVFLDVVHSHASKNVDDGLNMFDGTDHQYFHGGVRGQHPLWDSRLFNYDNWEVLRFLLSNLRWWVEEYCFDGFRFDGVTSMLYKHHGMGYSFSGDYREYFGEGVDEEAVTYLMLANEMLRELYPWIVTVAEDVSGMPTLALPTLDGGIGFDYRLAMAIPDMWIKYLKELKDEEWSMGHIVHTLTNRRSTEHTIAYCESHDQALVGDKTIAFWLMDKHMYTDMSRLFGRSDVVDRGMALHKMIRFITYTLGGEGYLNFMGNEFGHPEWLDFPREGNGESYHYARRQWNLVDNHDLRYQFLNQWDGDMHALESAYNFLSASPAYVSLKHEGDKVVAFDRAGLVFVFNFHPTQSYANYRIGVPKSGTYRIVLDSDSSKYDGFDRNSSETQFFSNVGPWHEREHYLEIYSPCRTVLVFATLQQEA